MTLNLERSELIAAGPAERLARLLEVELPDIENGAPLPLLWHWLYMLEIPAQSDLGPDGHSIRDTIPAPPDPGKRRMWAGGRVTLLGALRCGAVATRRSKVLASEVKEGRTGRLTFVTVEHEIVQHDTVVVTEHQNIVYRAPSVADATPQFASPPAPHEGSATESGEVEARSLDITATFLFRFSALTYNAHRIHYDRDYATNVEGYPALVTHGPLQAMAMAEIARSQGLRSEPGLSFDYRLVAPLFDGQGLTAHASRRDDAVYTEVRDNQGRQTARGVINQV
jgi:3-methylfumaryl-CoA hydratase